MDEIATQTLFEQLVQEKAKASDKNAMTPIRDGIRDFKDMQSHIERQQHLKQNIQTLMKQAPAEVRDNLQEILDSNNKYLDLQRVQQLLLQKNYNQLLKNGGITNLIRKDMLRKDLASKDLFNKLMQSYQSIKTDVVSLAQARETVSQTDATE